MQKLLIYLLRIGMSIIGLFSPHLVARIASFFLSRPPRRFLKKWMFDFLATGEQQDLPVAGHKIKTYTWQGEQDGVLFLHGWKSNSARWKYLIDMMKNKGFRLTAIDAPHHGDTTYPRFSPFDYAKCIEAAIQTFNPKMIVAHSVGAYAALYHHKFYGQPDIKYVLMAPTFDMMQPIREVFKILKLGKRSREAFIRHFEKESGHRLIDIRGDQLVQPKSPKGIVIHDVNDQTIMYQESVILEDSAPRLILYAVEEDGHRMQNKKTFDLILEEFYRTFYPKKI